MTTSTLRVPRKGEKYSASKCVIRTTETLLAYKRGNMLGVDWTEAQGWEDALKKILDDWTPMELAPEEMRIDNAVLELVRAVVQYYPVQEDDRRGYRE
jgi:hypothetical protein